MTAEVIERKHQEDLQRLRGFRLMDDDFMTKCFEGETGCIELVLRIVMEMPELKVIQSHTQVFVENLMNRSLRLDIVATDAEGRVINVEVQRSDRGAGRKRARYNSSMMDANLLRKSGDFDALPETWVIFITENDVMGDNLPLYHVDRVVSETDRLFGDGTHILYVNGAWRDGTPLGWLMHDFSCTAPADMHYEILADRVRYFKESREGTAIMCKVIEEMRIQEHEEGFQEGLAEGEKRGEKRGKKKGVKKGRKKEARAAALRMLQMGKYGLEEIAEISGLSSEEIEALAAKG